MSIVRYRKDEIPPLTPEQEAEFQAVAERPDSETDFSDIPKMDEVDFKYAIPAAKFWTMSGSEKNEVFDKILTMKEADRAARKAATLNTERVPLEA